MVFKKHEEIVVYQDAVKVATTQRKTPKTKVEKDMKWCLLFDSKCCCRKAWNVHNSAQFSKVLKFLWHVDNDLWCHKAWAKRRSIFKRSFGLTPPKATRKRTTMVVLVLGSWTLIFRLFFIVVKTEWHHNRKSRLQLKVNKSPQE